MFRLNRLKIYLAANISNPLLAPALVFAELQAGAFLRRGSFHELSLETARTIDPWMFGLDILVGSLVIGGVLGLVVAAVTYCAVQGAPKRRMFRDARASSRRSSREHELDGLGVRTRQDAVGSGVSHDRVRGPASVGRDADRCRLRARTDAGAARRRPPHVRPGRMAGRLHAAAALRPVGRRGNPSSRRRSREARARRRCGDYRSGRLDRYQRSAVERS